MSEKHLTLRDNIGTFAKEDEAFDLLTRLSWQLPIFVITSALIDLALASADHHSLPRCCHRLPP